MRPRVEKVGDLLRTELARIIQREVRDPRVGLATVSSVELSGDLSHAKVRISVLGDEETRTASILALSRAQGFIRSCLARSVRLRTVPALVFQLDRGAEHSQRISDILESLDGDTEGS